MNTYGNFDGDSSVILLCVRITSSQVKHAYQLSNPVIVKAAEATSTSIVLQETPASHGGLIEVISDDMQNFFYTYFTYNISLLHVSYLQHFG